MTIIKKTAGVGKKRLETLLANAKKIDVKVGWVKGKEYPDSNMTTAQAAMQNEFGLPADNIPPRPTGRPTIIKNQKRWSKIVESETKKILDGNQSAFGVMDILGLEVAGDWKTAIAQLTEPALSPVTIARRLEKYKDKVTVGNLTKPLIDTGIMFNSLTHEVKEA